MRLSSIVSLAIAAAIGALPAAGQAAAMLDANYTGSTTITLVHQGNANTLAQTFTALTTGRLTEYDLFLRPLAFGGPATFTISLTTTVGGSPVGGTALTSTTLASGDVTAERFRAFVPVGDVLVQAGTVYALYATAVHDDAFANVGFAGSVIGGYDGGDAYNSRVDNGEVVGPRSFDLFFRTYVDSGRQPTGAVPEPATWAMMTLGFGGIGASLRRRRGAALRAA